MIEKGYSREPIIYLQILTEKTTAALYAQDENLETAPSCV